MRKTSTAAAALAALGLLLSLCVGSASANLGYVHEGLIDGIAAPGTTPDEGFGEGSPSDLAVDQASDDVYVIDDHDQFVDVFNADGAYLRRITGASSPAGKFAPTAIAVDNSGGADAGYLYVADGLNDVVNIYGPTGTYLGQLDGTATPAGSFADPNGVAVGPGGAVFVSDSGHGVIDKFVPSGTPVEDSDYAVQFSDPSVSPGQIALDDDGNLYNAAGVFAKFSPTGEFLGDPSGGLDSASDIAINNAKSELLLDRYYYGVTIRKFGGPNRFEIGTGSSVGVAVEESSGRIYYTNLSYWIDYMRRVELPDVETGVATEITDTTAVIGGQVGLDEGGPITGCFVEYGSDTDYTETTPCDEATPYATERAVTTHLDGLSPGVVYHYRLVVENSEGRSNGEDRTFLSLEPPLIESATSSDVSETGAILHAEINPKGSETSYHFEYGTTPSYGSQIPIPDEAIGDGTDGVPVSVELTGLTPNTYYFRVVASNEFGTVRSAEQTFEFFPPDCPNSHVRQETNASYLPDCRAYELASPENTAGTTVVGAGPVSPYATNPSRVAFTGLYGEIPDTGADSMNFEGDLYIATRTNTGWQTRYVGLPGSEFLRAGGPPGTVEEGPDKVQLDVLTDLGMDRFLQWDATVGNLWNNSPHVFDAHGTELGRLPTGVEEGTAAGDGLECPWTPASGFHCEGEVAASADLEHFVFSSRRLAYHPDGVVGGAGSAYDNETDSGEISLISKLPGGEDIPSEGDGTSEYDYIRFPAVSRDGSHILMSTPYPGLDNDLHLYQWADGLVHDISEGHRVKFAGMTEDGSTVYFTSVEQVTTEDEDTSVDIYVWTESDDAIRLVSAGTNGRGNTDDCVALDGWTSKCDVGLIRENAFGAAAAGDGGNGHSDNAVAARNGDIYFYAPEQLDGDRGLRNARNLFVFRDGAIKFVATLRTDGYCNPENIYQGFDCTVGPVGRMQVTPDGRRVAFTTHSRLTAFDNAGYGRCDRLGNKCHFDVAEMYIWDPETRELVCTSCIPSGAVPSSHVQGSQNGRFLTDDGRVFFSTDDGLTPRDSNRVLDVYEYVKGRAQLISPGVGDSTRDSTQTGLAFRMKPGLVSVSGDGTDVYFATYETLVGQDRNGSELKIYDARANGGIPFTPPPPPCPAADECHGDSSRAPAAAEIGTGAFLGTQATVNRKPKKVRCRGKKAGKRASCKRKAKKHRRRQNPIVGSRGGRR